MRPRLIRCRCWSWPQWASISWSMPQLKEPRLSCTVGRPWSWEASAVLSAGWEAPPRPGLQAPPLPSSHRYMARRIVHEIVHVFGKCVSLEPVSDACVHCSDSLLRFITSLHGFSSLIRFDSLCLYLCLCLCHFSVFTTVSLPLSLPLPLVFGWFLAKQRKARQSKAEQIKVFEVTF